MSDLYDRSGEETDQIVDTHAKALATQLIVARILAREAVARRASEPDFLADEEMAILSSFGTPPIEDEAKALVGKTIEEVIKALRISRMLALKS